ncbi:MAG: AMP-binding protein, partial [Bacteroidia bacterium]|nr:AMP-binding protein [Bacteroidia bacterium]
MLFQLFYNSVQKFPQQPALWVDGELYSYADLYNSSQQIANALMPIANERVGLFASRSISAYSGVLGILQSGKTYVPLNPKFPESRNAAIAKLAGVNTIIVGKECLHAIAEITQLLDDHIQLLFPDCIESEIPANVLQSHTCFFVADSSHSATINPTPSHLAYILFTSGSTGLPKGVPIKQQSVLD